MRFRINSFPCIFLFLLLIMFFLPNTKAMIINEFVTDPQTDWDNSGTLTTNDEWIELYNNGPEAIDLTGWFLLLNDTTPEIEYLDGVINSGEYLVILNPSGIQNNDGQLRLYNSSNISVDEVKYGTFPAGTDEDNAPDGNANDFSNECLVRIPNAQDTNNDSLDFIKTECTYEAENGVIPSNEQDLIVIIGGRIVFNVFPRRLDFGYIQPNTINNPALNGPITFNVNGSTDDVNVEITEVVGSPFDIGLKIDGLIALGSSWIVPYTDPIKTVIPTLDVPSGVEEGEKKGTIVYTITGLPPP